MSKKKKTSEQAETGNATLGVVTHSGFDNPKEKAKSMVNDIQLKLGLSKDDAVNVAIYAIQTMITYNPISTTTDDREREYHKYWKDVEIELNVAYHCG